MKRLVIFFVMSLLLIGFVMAIGPTARTSETNLSTLKTPNQSDDSEDDEEHGNQAAITATNANQESIKEVIKEMLKERNKVRAEVKAQIKGTQTEVQIKKVFYTTTTDKDELILEVVEKFSLDKDTASSLLKIEKEDSEDNEENQETSEQSERLEISVSLNNQFTVVRVEKKFVLNTTDKAEILDAIVEKSQLSVDDVKSVMKIKDLKKLIQERNRIRFGETGVQCPTECSCTGSTIKCQLASGREMTIVAGKSGNVIVQVKGENMTTNVTLYKSEGKLYGVFKDNETKQVRVLPDQIKERIRERLQRQLENENITLSEDGEYEYQAEKKARLFFIFPVRVAVQAEINAETGEVVRLRTRWWDFLAKDEGEQLVGTSCGTVSPGTNDACCQNKGYDVWNSKTQQCEFSV